MTPPVGARRRPRAAGAAAVPRLRPQRRLRAGRGDRRLRGAAGDLRPARLPRADGRGAGHRRPRRAADVPGLAGRRRRRRRATPSCAAGSPRCAWPPPVRRRCPRRSGRRCATAPPSRSGRATGSPRRRRWSPAPWPPAGPSPTASAARCPASSSSCATPPTDAEPGDARADATTSHLEGPGEIWVRGPNLFSGYWPDGADGPDDDGWLGTGDLAYRDADGDLHLVDRRSDLILVSGFNVYPAEVERVLDAHPAVARERGHRRARRAHRVGRPRGRRPAPGQDVTSRSCRSTPPGRWPGTRCRRRCTSCRRCRTR